MGNPETTYGTLTPFQLADIAQDLLLQETLADRHRVEVLFRGGGGIFSRQVCVIKSERDVYPATVIRARYSGTYENEGHGSSLREGKYVAFPLHHYEVPRAATGDDDTCCSFFASVNTNFIGLGDTPQAAYDDLVDKLLALPSANRPNSYSTPTS